jgi:hypothetical protein
MVEVFQCGTYCTELCDGGLGGVFTDAGHKFTPRLS